MVEAKDTIILYSGNKNSVELYLDALLAEQAEISFKSGYKQAIEEVVEFVESHGMHLNHHNKEWRKKLKEWRL